ncbi:uncharacterized protein LOC107315796 isoform X2 [Coturnix japonica]|uniref:uncharacterized protein LOC107315796 isoform X2 n=1 Tax=Coturnix japonica TaxID=93934 RepID=UPI0007775F5C|nr:uncharacterized protein LOC107315796 isoform X2 [Coturnix japonica]
MRRREGATSLGSSTSTLAAPFGDIPPLARKEPKSRPFSSPAARCFPLRSQAGGGCGSARLYSAAGGSPVPCCSAPYGLSTAELQGIPPTQDFHAEKHLPYPYVFPHCDFPRKEEVDNGKPTIAPSLALSTARPGRREISAFLEKRCVRRAASLCPQSRARNQSQPLQLDGTRQLRGGFYCRKVFCKVAHRRK